MKKAIRLLVANPFSWSILNFFYKIFNRFKFEKELIPIEIANDLRKEKEDKLKQKFSDLTVRNGVFKGMRYPEFIAHGSSMFPKLLGSYESELNTEFENLIKNKYTEVIDVGCAEGYYAVGIAMRMEKTKVFAFDVNTEALDSCKKMARLNKVDDRMTYGSFFSDKDLSKFKFSGKGLVICDCEGYEIELFTPASIANLKNCDILIELHDLYNEKITPTIIKVFKESHTIRFVYSENTFLRLEKTGLRGDLTDEEVKDFFTERNGIMQWAIITSKL